MPVGQIIMYLILGLFGLVILVFLGVFLKYFRIWLRAQLTRVPISFSELIGMRFRRVDPDVIVKAHGQAAYAGLDLTREDLEVHYLKEGRVPLVVIALIAAGRAGVELSWEEACDMDLNGEDPTEYVRRVVKDAEASEPEPRPKPESSPADSTTGPGSLSPAFRRNDDRT